MAAVSVLTLNFCCLSSGCRRSAASSTLTVPSVGLMEAASPHKSIETLTVCFRYRDKEMRILSHKLPGENETC